MANCQLGNQLAQPRPVGSVEEQRRDRLIGVEGITRPLYRHLRERVDPHVGGFLVQIPVKGISDRRHSRFDHREHSPRAKHARSLFEKRDRSLEMVQYVDHYHAGELAIGKSQAMRITDGIDSGERQNVDRQDIAPDLLDVRRAAADVEKWAIRACRRQSTMVIGIKYAQSRLIEPNTTMLNLARIRDDALGCTL